MHGELETHGFEKRSDEVEFKCEEVDAEIDSWSVRLICKMQKMQGQLFNAKRLKRESGKRKTTGTGKNSRWVIDSVPLKRQRQNGLCTQVGENGLMKLLKQIFVHLEKTQNGCLGEIDFWSVHSLAELNSFPFWAFLKSWALLALWSWADHSLSFLKPFAC